MLCKRKNTGCQLQLNCIVFVLLLVLQMPVHRLYAQDQKVAVIKLSFEQTDSTKTCKATVVSDGAPVKEKEVHLYVKRLYSLLPVGKVASTDSLGEAEISFPKDLPGDQNGMLTVIAKIEKDDVYGTVETQSQVKWGAAPKAELLHLSSRSLSASRENAPMFLVIASSLIIIVIWGTIFYVVFQLLKIKKAARVVKKLSVAEG